MPRTATFASAMRLWSGMLLASLASFTTIFVWGTILVAHFVMRRQVARGRLERGEFAMPGWPLPSLLALAFFAVVLVAMALSRDTRPALVAGAERQLSRLVRLIPWPEDDATGCDPVFDQVLRDFPDQRNAVMTDLGVND